MHLTTDLPDGCAAARTFPSMTTTPPPFSPFAYNRAVRASLLSPIAHHVAMTLVTYTNRAGVAWPS